MSDEITSRPSTCARVLAAIRPAVEAARQRARSKDVSVGVITAECPFVEHSAGESALPKDALYRVGSITKTYTAAVILHFVAEGVVGLDEPIERFALGISGEKEITIRQLLNHSSGLFNYKEDPTFAEHWTPRERLDHGADKPRYFSPGRGWHYSNTNYIALGFIAEQLGGADIATLIRELVLVPQGLHASYFDGEEALEGTIAASYAASGARIPVQDGLDGAWADGAMVASMYDVTRWVRAYASGSATPTLVSDLFAGVSIPGAPMTYGLGLFNLPAAVTGDVAAHGHSGDIVGFHSWAAYLPEREWTVSVIANQDGAAPNVIMLAVLDALKSLYPAH